MRRIESRQWRPGDIIPNEAVLSEEFGCARATVNRALRGLAESGLLERRRRAGTRVALHPVRKATINIPLIRREIEAKHLTYGYSLLSRAMSEPPPNIMARMQTHSGEKLMHLVAVHSADRRPYVYEDRWINPQAVPEVESIDFEAQSANEWLVMNVPFEAGDVSFSATTASRKDCSILACKPGEGLFVMDRSTWSRKQMITSVRLTFASGYRIHTQI